MLYHVSRGRLFSLLSSIPLHGYTTAWYIITFLWTFVCFWTVCFLPLSSILEARYPHIMSTHTLYLEGILWEVQPLLNRVGASLYFKIIFNGF